MCGNILDLSEWLLLFNAKRSNCSALSWHKRIDEMIMMST